MDKGKKREEATQEGDKDNMGWRYKKSWNDGER
jgi:hypothetical protein